MATKAPQKKVASKVTVPKKGRDPEKLLTFIEELKKQWVATIDALVDPLVIVSEEYDIKKANQAMARFAGAKDVKTIIGEKCYKVFAKRQSPCPGCLVPETIAKRRAITFNLEEVRGKLFYEVSAQPIFKDKSKEIDGVVTVYRDRTEAKALQASLLQNEKLASIGLLAGGVAHEINNPLGGILIFSQVLLRSVDKESKHYPDLIEIEAAAQRCKEIVARLLDFARAQPASQPNKPGPVDVNEAAKSALRFAKVAKGANKIRVKEKWGQIPEVLADRNVLIQLFLNLIQNAFQAMPSGGTLTLTSKIEKKGGRDFGVWVVEDNGIGIDKHHLAKIFDPFFTTKEPGQGTGLGLSICYGICQELGGRLEVKSRINEGTKFFVTLPVCLPKK